MTELVRVDGRDGALVLLRVDDDTILGVQVTIEHVIVAPTETFTVNLTLRHTNGKWTID